MKKLVIFLIPLIVSIPTFAKEKSSFTENFSLVKYSGDNIRKVFEIDIFSERIPLSIIDTVENINQIQGNMYNLIYGQQEDINSEKKSESLAEGYLRRLAEKNKKSRKKSGIGRLAAGGVFLTLSAVILFSEEEEWEGVIGGRIFWGLSTTITGVVCAGGGVLTLAIPSRTERKFDNVLSISDPAKRERASHEALSSLAARGKKLRIITSAVIAGIGVYCTLKDGNLVPAVAFGGGSAAYYFLRKTPAERAFQDYLKERKSKQRKELALRVGIMPYGGVKISLALSF